MTATLYQTPNMEAAIRLMVARNHYAMAYVDYHCKRRIRLRANLIADIPMTVVRPWNRFADKSMEKWRDKGGLLHYLGDRVSRPPVRTDAMLIVEAPFQYTDFAAITREVVSEVIVYRPPTWELHTEAIEALYPTSELAATLDQVVTGLMGYGAMSSSDNLAAIRLSGFAPDDTAVFTASDIEAITGMTERQVRAVLMVARFRGLYSRYHPYRLNIRPDEPDLAWAYDILEAEPDVYRGLRMLRMNDPLAGPQQGLDKAIKELYQQKYIERKPCIYVVTQGFKPLNPLVVDATSNARRGDWFKLMTAIDNAPIYKE